MPINFELPKPGDVTETLEKIKTWLASDSGKCTGDENSGTLETAGVECAYTVKDNCIEISVTKCPLVARPLVKKTITSLFSTYAS